MKKFYIFSIVIVTILFSGCAKSLDIYNKPALFWYTKMVSSISSGNLDKADDFYSSLEGEHIASPLLKEATMMLFVAHMRNNEYLLAQHFLDQYIQRYATENGKEYAEYMKIKAKYFSLPNPRRDQAMIDKAISEAKLFKLNYPHSDYYSVVDSMLTRLIMGKVSLNKTISELYLRLDKPKASLYYRNISPQPWIVWSDVARAKSPWYREWFEGDGTSSWYAFMIPDTLSIVSKNLNKDTTKESN